MSQPKRPSNCYRVLSLGQRGVGKTVFLAGAYLDLRDSGEGVSLKTLNDATNSNVTALLTHIEKTGDYPPPTMKVDTFNFGLSRRSRWGTVNYTIALNDIPGEICDIHRPDFANQVAVSHGCCVFFDAEALVNIPGYRAQVQPIVDLLVSIASLTANNGKFYPISLIFTKCDLVGQPPNNMLLVEASAKWITDQLHSTGVHFHTFYSAVQAVADKGRTRIVSRGGAGAAIFWLTEQLLLNAKDPNMLATTLQSVYSPSLRRFIPSPAAESSRPWWRQVTSAMFGVATAIAVLSVRALGWYAYSWSSPTSVAERLLAQYETILERSPNNIEALVNVTNLRQQKQDFVGALKSTRRLVALQPGQVEWQVNMARLLYITGDKQGASQAYENILKSHPNDLSALRERAVLLSQSENPKDRQKAKELALRALKYAPTAERQELRTLLASLADVAASER